jgi:hypothetical protein
VEIMARNQTIRTANEIINTVLLRVGNLDLVDEAQAELNNILDRLYADYKWPFLTNTITDNIAAASDEDLPNDFNEMNSRWSIRLVTSEGAVLPMNVVSDPDFDVYGVQQPTSAFPQGIHINFKDNTFRLVPHCTTDIDYVLTYQLVYDPITDFDLPINFPNDSLITQLLFVWACQHEDDDRYTTEFTRAEKMISDFYATFSASALRQSRLAMNPARFPLLMNRR